ncbi:MAG: hypothetical protein HKN92_07940 [Chitinophagales bacterium]|nr:hypothetical protein [Chitinophagales bacterium]
MLKGNKLTPILIILLLLGLVAGFFAVNSGIKSKKLSEEKEELTFQLADVMKDLETSRVTLDTMRGKNAMLDSLLSRRSQKLDSMTTVVENLLRSNRINRSELSKAQKMLAQLQEENTFYVSRIDSLYTQNVKLAELSDSLQVKLTEEIIISSQLRTENTMLSDKVAMGSLLQANNMYVTGIKTKSSGKEVETNKTKRMEQIKVCFETGENRVRDIGRVTLHLRIVNPEGVALSIQSLGSGVFIDSTSGKEIQYTKELVFNYDNTNKQVCAYWANNIFSPGKYTAEIYQDGHKLRVKEFELK